jgi:predicted nucleotidyltransferase
MFSGLGVPDETVTVESLEGGIELDLVTHDAAKFFRLMLRKNGYVLEQLLSPLVVHTTPVHEELKSLAPGVITRHHAHHYLGFARTQWRLFTNERRVKPLLYTYRVLLTGIHLMQTGQVEANLVRLNESARLTHVADLIARKTAGREDDLLGGDDLVFHEQEYLRLTAGLEAAHNASTLPHEPSAGPALSALLVRIRLDQPAGDA